MKKKLKCYGWAGIVNDKIDKTVERYNDDKVYSIYTSEKKARKHYQGITKVLITEVEK